MNYKFYLLDHLEAVTKTTGGGGGGGGVAASAVHKGDNNPSKHKTFV